MTISDELMMGGLTPDHELFFPRQPDDPEMRESTSIWLYEENGAFAFPRVGIEAEAKSWENRRHQGNFAVAGGRVLNGAGIGHAHSPFGPDGRPTILGAGPIAFRCIEPFRKWEVTYDGLAVDCSIDEMIARSFDPEKKVPVRFAVQLTMVTPCWVQNTPPEMVAKMSPEDAMDAEHMGVGWRLEHLFRAEGEFHLDGKRHDFRGQGSRIKRQSVRPLAGFRGHCWQSAVFPDGRAFGFIAYPPSKDNPKTYFDGYIYQNGKMYPVRPVEIPWLRRVVGEGDDVSLALESELGITRISGRTALSTFRVGHPELVGLTLQQGGTHYTWDGQSAYGMIERSSFEDLTTFE
jgi:hypothetical protein